MSGFSHRLARAISGGRVAQGHPQTREEVLVRLLRKRAAAHCAGLTDLEASLRRQIAWSLPVRRGNGASPSRGGPSAFDHWQSRS